MNYPSRSPACCRLSRLANCVGVGLLLAAFGCSQRTPSAAPNQRALRLATTTSTRDSGLLDVLLPFFHKQVDVRVDVIGVGTGAALKLGESGDADVLIVHARAAELAYMKAGHGVRREEFMFNRFVILGPPGDTLGLRDLTPIDAFRKIAKEKAPFCSRGDDSGTHKRELELWEAGGGKASWQEYLETGQGMGATLTIADERRTYVLADMGTYLKFKDKIELVPLVAKGERLKNPYGAIVVNAPPPGGPHPSAQKLVDFLISNVAQQHIRDYQLEGQQLFTPTRLDDPPEPPTAAAHDASEAPDSTP